MPFSMRELFWMVKGRNESRDRAAWMPWSNFLCMYANVNRDRKKQRRPFQPSDFYPFSMPKRKREKLPVADISVLKAFLSDGDPNKDTTVLKKYFDEHEKAKPCGSVQEPSNPEQREDERPEYFGRGVNR